jgi:energy-coupling factor transporter ATP-binding protein EcfA2
MTRLVLDRVSFWYPATERAALTEVSLTVAPGEVVALAGNVGAGASTLLLVASGLAPRVTGGRLKGTVEAPLSALLLPTPWTQSSGMAFTVWDEVAFGPANLGWPIDRIRGAVDAALAALEIAPLASRDPATLSGGELQRVILAGLIAMESSLLLLDEPTAELDPAGAALVWRVTRALAGEGKSVVVATSDLDAVPALADRVVWLEQGMVRRTGVPADVLADDAVWERGPGGPAVAGVWRAAGLAAPHPLSVAAARERLR